MCKMAFNIKHLQYLHCKIARKQLQQQNKQETTQHTKQWNYSLYYYINAESMIYLETSDDDVIKDSWT